MLPACIGDYKPPYPPELPLDTYRPFPERELAPEVFTAALAGARLARKGVYVDVFVQIPVDRRSEHPPGLRDIGFFLSADPSEFLEMRDADGVSIALRPVAYPERWFVSGTYSYGGPPHYRVDDGLCIQVVMARTLHQLPEGTYGFRLIEPPSDRYLASTLAPSDLEWHEVQVRWPQE